MKKTIYVEAGNRIRSIREKKHFTRDYVSAITGISSKFLYEIENGLKGFSADNLYRISKALDVSSEYILTGRAKNQFDDEIQEELSLFDDDERAYVLKMIKDIYIVFKK